ncbi:MAG: cysteine desulfurase [Xanthomonadales bacterium]|nr:cysteine desulfurase [Xanthomonadales bacterium]
MSATAIRPTTSRSLDPAQIRAQFPILQRQVNGHPLTYLDSANTAQKPQAVIDALVQFYTRHNANVARAVHTLGEEATAAYEAVRGRIAALLGLPDTAGIVYTRGTTEAINLVAHSWLRPRLQPGDEILVTAMEHHANIVPWQLLADSVGARVVPVPVQADGTLDLDDFRRLINDRTKLVGVVHVSNVLGTINPIAQIAELTRAREIPLLVDGSQAAPHLAIDVPALGCDFYCFTGHKLYGPTGSGALWVRPALLEQMQPFMGGGEMIARVSFEGTTYAEPPHRFEAGTPNIAGIVGLGVAIDWVLALGLDRMAAHEAMLAEHMMDALGQIEGLRLLGETAERAPVFSFVVEGAHAHDLAMILDQDGIAVRSGHHCAHPLLQQLGVSATLRASLGIYNTIEEIDHFAQSLERARRMLVG